MRTRPRFIIGFMSRPIASFVCFFVISIPVNAAEPVSRALNSGWQFRALESTDHPGVQNWHAAQVPGVVHTDLLRNGLIPEPFDQDSDFRLQWIGLTDLEYETTLQVDADTLAHAHVDLVCQGQDTFADVYLNGQAILRTNNMFRRWRLSAKPSLVAGNNALRIVFHSAVKYMLPYAKSLPYLLPSISTHNFGNEKNIATVPYTRKGHTNMVGTGGRVFLPRGSGSLFCSKAGTHSALTIFTSISERSRRTRPA